MLVMTGGGRAELERPVDLGYLSLGDLRRITCGAVDSEASPRSVSR